MVNEQQMELFKKRVHTPYTEAWVMIKEMRDTENKDDKYWDEYMNKCKSFSERYPYEIGQSICRILYDAMDEVIRIERQK